MRQRYLLPLLLLLLLPVTGSAQEAFLSPSTPFSATPKREVRAVWLTTISGLDWPRAYATNAASIEKQKKELRDILDKLQLAGINTVLFQTRIRATTIYPSNYEPWDVALTGQAGRHPGYDPLAFAIDECHKRGMELHAWMVTIPIGKWNSFGCQRLRKKYPGMVIKVGAEGYMNPEKTQTATYLADMCAEVVGRYDVDGIHLDYIRYPETWKYKQSKNICRQHITDIVSAISRRVKAAKPWVKMSCSPIGKYDDLPRYSSRGWNARTTVCQDAAAWLRDGLMDALFPMMYFQGDNFYPFAIDWKTRSYGRIIAPGLAAYMLSPSERNWSLDVITREMAVLRQNNMGHTFFRSKFFTDNVKGLYQFTANDFNTSLALPPAMEWMNAKRPDAPTQLKIDTLASVMSWTGARANNDSPDLYYNIYSSRTTPVDIDDARNLVVARLNSTRQRIVIEPDRYYAVTAIDRYGNESEALQSHSKPAPRAVRTVLLACDGQQVKLPVSNEPIDYEYFVAQSLQGNILKTLPRRGDYVDVSALAEGMYLLESIGSGGKNHRIGHFIIKRN